MNAGQFKRQTHCKRGHALEGANVYISPKLKKHACLTCLHRRPSHRTTEQYREAARKRRAKFSVQMNEKRRNAKYELNGDWIRLSIRLRKHGLTLDQYHAIVERQDFLCAVCEAPLNAKRNENIDHDHDSQHIRGILCGPCNKGIGHFRDNPALMTRAASYVLHS